jgi:putative NADH-flavin reductase
MQITIFGANGRVGRILVTDALEAGYSVVAFVHGNTTFDEHKNLKIVAGDIYNVKDIDKALIGSSAVISALGSWGTPNKDILTTGIKNIIPLMSKHNIKRIITLTGADANTIGDEPGLISTLTRPLLKTFFKKILLDGEEHMRLLCNSNLDWTVLRSPAMNSRGNKANYKISHVRPMPWQTINRASAAIALLNMLEENNSIGQAPYITRK